MTPPLLLDENPFGSPVTWVAGLIVADSDRGDFAVFGTGFLVGPGLAFTARHVVDEIFKRFRGASASEVTDGFAPGVQLGTAGLGTGTLLKWDVVGYCYSQEIDIAGLLLELSEDTPLPPALGFPRIDLRPPALGDTIIGFGYPRTEWRADRRGAFAVRSSPATTKGLARELYPLRRDSALLPFPCMRTTCRFDPGMSGGPVFNLKGRVVAMVTAGLDGGSESEEPLSYASLIWPAMGLRATHGASPSFHGPLLDQARQGRLQVLNLDLIRYSEDDATLRLHFGGNPETPEVVD